MKKASKAVITSLSFAAGAVAAALFLCNLDYYVPYVGADYENRTGRVTWYKQKGLNK